MSDTTDPEYDNTAYFGSWSGGAFRGPVQYWVLHHLFVTLGLVFRVTAGTSVGSINGSMFAQHKWEKLLEIYNSIDGKSAFLKFRKFHLLTWPFWACYWLVSDFVRARWGWRWPLWIGGFYSMDPLHKLLTKFVQTSDFVVPFVAHVISSNTGIRYQIDSRAVQSPRMRLGILCSSCMAPFMQPPKMDLDQNADMLDVRKRLFEKAEEMKTKKMAAWLETAE